MNRKKLRLALVGKDVSKSDSERIHRFILKKWDLSCEYERFSVTAEEFDGVMRRLLGDFDGFNVTIPYKRDVMAYLDETAGDAFAFGAVNTVVTSSKTGYNTDGIGFMLMLERATVTVKGKKVLVLGAGGAGRSTAAALKQAGAEVWVYQRRKEKLEEVCAELGVYAAEKPTSGYNLLVNCTGVGMHETEGISPVDESVFCGVETAVDLIYTPEKSEFLCLAERQGSRILNGAAMLFYQAYYADCLYVGKTPSGEEAETLYKEYLTTTKD